MINWSKYKEYGFFGSLFLMFLAIAVFTVYMYLGWDDPIDESDYVEVKLPIIEWGKYTNLSK